MISPLDGSTPFATTADGSVFAYKPKGTPKFTVVYATTTVAEFDRAWTIEALATRYSATGTVISSLAESGAEARSISAAGTVRSAGVTSGSSATTYPETGAVRSAGVLSGSDTEATASTGTVGADLSLSGVSATTYSEAGTLRSAGAASGLSATTYVEAGTVRSGAGLSGAATDTPATVTSTPRVGGGGTAAYRFPLTPQERDGEAYTSLRLSGTCETRNTILESEPDDETALLLLGVL